MLTIEAIKAKLTKVSADGVPAVTTAGDVVSLTYASDALGARVSADVEALRTLDGQPLASSEQTDPPQFGGPQTTVVVLRYGARPAKS